VIREVACQSGEAHGAPINKQAFILELSKHSSLFFLGVSMKKTKRFNTKMKQPLFIDFIRLFDLLVR
jgi:hypothetical protein